MKTFSFAFGVAAITLVAAALWQFREARNRASHWQKVDAAVTNGRIIKRLTLVGDKAGIGNEGASGPRFQAEFELSYEYKGTHYREWLKAHSSKNRSACEAILGQYSKGSRHSVWIDPDSPQQIALRIEGWDYYLSAKICAAAGCLCGFVWLAGFFRLPALRRRFKGFPEELRA